MLVALRVVPLVRTVAPRWVVVLLCEWYNRAPRCLWVGYKLLVLEVSHGAQKSNYKHSMAITFHAKFVCNIRGLENFNINSKTLTAYYFFKKIMLHGRIDILDPKILSICNVFSFCLLLYFPKHALQLHLFLAHNRILKYFITTRLLSSLHSPPQELNMSRLTLHLLQLLNVIPIISVILTGESNFHVHPLQ